MLQREEVVAARLDLHQQAVEGGDVDSGRVQPALERLHERRARAGEGIEDMFAGPEVAIDHHLDQLRDELAQIGMQAMDVLRPLSLGKVALRPGEVEVELAVEGFLGQRHARIDSTRAV